MVQSQLAVAACTHSNHHQGHKQMHHATATCARAKYTCTLPQSLNTVTCGRKAQFAHIKLDPNNTQVACLLRPYDCVDGADCSSSVALYSCRQQASQPAGRLAKCPAEQRTAVVARFLTPLTSCAR